MMKFYSSFTVLLLFFSACAFSQITSSTGYTATELATTLAGEGVTVSGASLTCYSTGSGKFDCVDCNVGIDSGVVLTTGVASEIVGPNNSGGVWTDVPTSGDADLNALPGIGTTFDACVLEFDLVPNADTVSFQYVFGSEEYLEWVGSFNDVFAFFISGPGIAGSPNMALIPGTALPVSISNVNPGSYSMYYNNNGDGFTAPYSTDAFYIQYDGFTDVFTAFHSVTPCETYHLKLAIADQFDGLFDSGVFLKANSLTTNYTAVFDFPGSGFGLAGEYCQDDPDPSPALDPDATSGTWTGSPAGLVIDSVTGTIDLDASLPGSYTVTNTLIVGFCTFDTITYAAPISITVPPLAGFSYTGSPFCSNDVDPLPVYDPGASAGTFSATPGGLTLNTSTGAIDLSTSFPNTYVVTNYKPGAGACPDVYETDTIVINPIYVIPQNVHICTGDSYVLPDGTSTGTAGSYATLLTAVTGCDSTINTTLVVDPVYSIDVSAAICDDASYVLPDGTVVSASGTYISNLFTASGCDSTINTTLTVHPTYATSVSADICSGYSYTLPDGSSVSAAGTYPVTFSTIYGCDSTITTTVNVVTVVDVDVYPAICEGDSYILPDGTSASVAGDYTTYYTSTSGCDSNIHTHLTVNPLPVINFPLSSVACLESGSVLLNATPAGGTYSGSFVSGSTFDVTGAGVGGPYSITYSYTDANGCSNTDTENISVEQNFANATGDTTIYSGQITPLSAFAGGDYVWSPFVGLSCWDCSSPSAFPTETTTYVITSTDEWGCVASDSVTVTVVPDPGTLVFIPNAFTPNGDNMNDYFYVFGLSITNIKLMTIYDRWGTIVFSAENLGVNDQTKGWDGTYAGREINAGVFAYYIELEFKDGESISKRGNVTVLK